MICKSCEKRDMDQNQIVCSYCHENELKSEWIEETQEEAAE